ncbi:hypothetical protein DFQ11_1226 [Winogradskyella epiphytica]|uniref:Uncharacterized protein n=3 Tax=Flavobacteriales TaxID=200644 RepID=A0A2V4WT07_9FLAO|nr:hypothetical protein DFQ11_1226 [Winogradskyella epiphytica]GGW75286.1 hypothetical protein GCM10008085_28980 [Winogradskyella epiphytica]|tara:strand:+ start:6309 stop:6791 length:483 start_codon:yes stop_codon:yes gene_type:complete
MYSNEIEMYPDIILWLEKQLKGKYGKKAKKITVLDTHDSDLLNFIIKLKYQRFFPEFTTYKIRQDITGFIEYEDKVDLVFVECKNGKLSLINLSQLIGYSCIALPVISILIAPQGMGTTLSKLLTSFNRTDILEFRPNRKIQVLKWDYNKKDIDRMNSIT